MFWRKSKAEAAEAAKAEAAKLEAAAEAARAERIEAATRAEAAARLAFKAEQEAAVAASAVRAPAVDAPKLTITAPPAAQHQTVPHAQAAPAASHVVAAPVAVQASAPAALTGASVTRLIQPKNVKSWQTAARALGEVMSVLQHSKRFRATALGDLDWMIMPALWAGQYKLGKEVADPGAPPTAVIFWARVSAAVDQRLAQNPSAPIKLTPEEWISGDIVWVVEAVGPDAVVSDMLRQLSDEVVRGPIKVRTLRPDGKATTAVITAKPRPPTAQPAR